MEIITKLPRYSDGEVDRAFLKEIQNGFKLELETMKNREDIAKKEAQELKGKTHPVLGKCVAVMPPREYFRLVAKYGHDTVHSKEFLRYFHKKEREMSPHST